MSAKNGHHHWIMQRITAVILAFSVFWVLCISAGASSKSMIEIVEMLKCPCNIVPLMIFVIAGFYHGALGMQVIFEDYISCKYGRIIMTIFVKLFTFVTIIASLSALTYLMVL